MDDIRRLFFALPVSCHWPETYPEGRILTQTNRHLTLAFLGDSDWSKLNQSLKQFSGFQRKVGSATLFNNCLFLPEKHSRVVSWEVLENSSYFSSVINELHNWLRQEGFLQDLKQFVPHVTIARAPFNIDSWKEDFQLRAVSFQEIHLYESLGHSQYRSLWSFPFLLPFEEISHVADRGFIIQGENIQEIYEHAKIALFFDEPIYLPFVNFHKKVDSLEDTIIALNELISICDEKIGCGYKAVSFTGELGINNNVLVWEMIVDV